MSGLPMRRCTDCGRVLFPPRPVCPGCSAVSFDTDTAWSGVVEEVTGRAPVLASIRTDLGPVVIGALHVDVHSGQRVPLSAVRPAGTGEPVAFVPVPTEEEPA